MTSSTSWSSTAKVGLAFQLADDIIDLTGHPDVSGKTRGTDLREGVDASPVLLLRRDAYEHGPPPRRPHRKCSI